LFSCASNSAREITEMIKEKGLNRVVLAACSPRTLEPLFRDTLRDAGINQYFYDMANIREHCSWVHSKEKDAATQKAKDITRMSVARSRYLEPLQEIELPVDKKALVAGGGISGMTCALSIARQGHEVYLVEKNPELVLIDVREPHEWEICHIEGATLIPLGQLPERLNQLDGHQEIVTHCHRGMRSMQALAILRAAGFSRVRSLNGGIDAWSAHVDPSVPRY